MKFSSIPARTQLPLALRAASVLFVAALGCTEDVPDQTRLSALTSSERQVLCEELADTVPSPDEAFSCADGSTVRFSELDATRCNATPMGGCAASAGDVRACLEALVADPCAASAARPAACAPLQAAGCGALGVAPALSEQCPAAAASDLGPFEGIYELVRHTQNEASCDVEGASVLGDDTQRLFVVIGAELFGSPVAALRSCRDLADCQAMAAEIRSASQDPVVRVVEPATPAPELSDLFLCKAPTVGSLLGGGYSVGNRPEGSCALSRTPTTLTRSIDGSLRAERRTFAWTTPSEDDSCIYDGSKPPARAACSELEVYEGRMLSSAL